MYYYYNCIRILTPVDLVLVFNLKTVSFEISSWMINNVTLFFAATTQKPANSKVKPGNILNTDSYLNNSISKDMFEFVKQWIYPCIFFSTNILDIKKMCNFIINYVMQHAETRLFSLFDICHKSTFK